MKLLITGATGFVGKTLIPYLYRHNIKALCLLVRSRKKADSLFAGLPLTVISTEDDEWSAAVTDFNPDATIHLAAYFTGRRDDAAIDKLIGANLRFTTHLLEALSHTRCRHFVNIGTFTEFVDGGGEYKANNLYSATKSAERSIIAYYQTQSVWSWINVVLYSPYGRVNASKKVIDYLVDAVGADTPVPFSPGEQVLDFIHVDDVADFFLCLIKKLDKLNAPYYQFHLGTGQGHSIRQVATVIEKVFHEKVNADWGGRPYSPTDAMYAVAPINKNICLLDWKAKLSLEQGISILRDEVKAGRS